MSLIAKAEKATNASALKAKDAANFPIEERKEEVTQQQAGETFLTVPSEVLEPQIKPVIRAPVQQEVVPEEDDETKEKFKDSLATFKIWRTRTKRLQANHYSQDRPG